MGTSLRLKGTAVLALLALPVAGGARAEDRLGVFEFFVRGAGEYCQAAAPAVRNLQAEMRGRALLLEYPYDVFRDSRAEVWWAAYSGSGAVYLPLVMVGSGFETSTGPVDYEARYRAMLEDELARPPGAALKAFFHRAPDGTRIHVRATNLGTSSIGPAQAATLWAIAWEDAPIGLTSTWVHQAASLPLGASLPAGGTATATLALPPSAGAGRFRYLALLDHRPAGGTRFDMLQAVVAEEAGLSAEPASLTLSPSRPEADVLLDGPHVLAWSATADQPWLSVTPPAGSLPATARVRLTGSPPEGSRGTVRLDASGSGMAFSATVDVRVEAGEPPRRVAIVPAAAHAHGAFGTLWRTDVAAVNAGNEPAQLALTFVPVSGAPVDRAAALLPAGTQEWDDVLCSLFDADPASSVSGSVRIESDRAISISSRTFTEGADGTLGGYLPAVTAADALTPGATGVLPQLCRGPDFRTNVGVTNLGETEAVVTVRLSGEDGEALGDPLVVTVPPGGLSQVDDAFSASGAGDRAFAFATVEAASPGAVVWAYASVIDNRTGDPTIVPLEVLPEASASLRSAASPERTVPAVAHSPGAHESLWRTDLAVVNLTGADVGLEVRFVPEGGGEARTCVERIAPGTRPFPDVLVSLLGLDAAAPWSGALCLRPDGPLVVSSRTFNAAPGGTYGAHLAGLDASRAVSAGRPGTLPQLSRGDSVRTNVGLTNPGTEEVVVAVRLHGADGSQLGTGWVARVPPGALVQRDVFAECGAPDARVAWARVEVLTEGGQAFAYASVIDNDSGDPTIVPVRVP